MYIISSFLVLSAVPICLLLNNTKKKTVTLQPEGIKKPRKQKTSHFFNTQKLDENAKKTIMSG